jgi:hypothetical protein
MAGLVDEIGLADEMKLGNFKPVSHKVHTFMTNRGCQRGRANASKF